MTAMCGTTHVCDISIMILRCDPLRLVVPLRTSCPGLARASTTFFAVGTKDLDGRNRSGDDDRGTVATI